MNDAKVTWALKELGAVKKKHEGKHYDTFETNVHAMVSDCIEIIEGLQKDLNAAMEEIRRLKVGA